MAECNKSTKVINSRIENFRHFSPAERLAKTLQHAGLEASYGALFNGSDSADAALSMTVANAMIENVVGKFELPLGIATNFLINGTDYLIPMVVEEPSVVAAASHMAKIVRGCGGFVMDSDLPIMRGQVQVLGITDLQGAKQRLLAASAELIELANRRDKVLLALGGGCQQIEVHLFESSAVGPMLVLHLLVDVRDAMGANAVNSMAETIAPLVEELSGGAVRLRILSNLADRRLVRGKVRIPASALTNEQFDGAEVAQGIVEAGALAMIDPYRAATHNKGIMNGIDPIVIATGNDWRAIEAGAHAWAAMSGRYKALSNWEIDPQGFLIGTIELPMALGIVGGATKTHPTAQASLALMNIQSARELAEVTVAVGLAQNLAALKALATEGIQKGHMALHARNVAIAAGASGANIEVVSKAMVSEGNINMERAEALLAVL
ncbi:MAG: hydroxymethylglutaryl-CoA reductase, degradative [Oceanospirillaceae bacterium]|nr:hydroxymethylglutaryl-CoA reductase, degradative [Oceanospirillaceae bacterium]